MALLVESSTVYESSATATDHVVTKPSGVVSGDLLVIVACVTSTGTPTTWPSGFTQRVNVTDSGSAEHLRVATKRAGGSEPSTYTVTLGAARNCVIFMLRISGDDALQANPVHTSATTDETSGSTSHPSPSVTTSVDNTLIFYALCDSAGTAYTEDTGYPPGTTLVGMKISNAGSADPVGGLSYKALASAGSSGTGTWTSDSSVTGVTATFAIAPAVISLISERRVFRGVGRGIARGV